MSFWERVCVVFAMADQALWELSVRFFRVQRLCALVRIIARVQRVFSWRKHAAGEIVERHRVAIQLHPLTIECVAESLSLWRGLRSAGHPAQLMLGCRTALGHLEAHAWVELGGQIVSDPEGDHSSWQSFDAPLLRGDQ